MTDGAVHVGLQGFTGMSENAVFVPNLLLERPEHACMHKHTEPQKQNKRADS